jgi:kumamolisin
MSLTPLIGSERTLATSASIVGRLKPGRLVRITVLVRPEKDPESNELAGFATQLASSPLRERAPLSREAYTATYGIAPSDVRRVMQFARKYGLRVVGQPNRGARTVDLQGTATTMGRVFGVELVRVQEQGNIYRSYTGPISIPSDAENLIENIFGFSTRPQVSPRIAYLPRPGIAAPHVGAAAFTADQVAKAYNFPAATGKGQTIAILELGGGARVRDLVTYFKSLNIPKPTIIFVPVGGGSNSPTGNPDSADGEVMLDIEVAGAVAPGAKIVVYFGLNTNQGFFRLINRAVHDRRYSPSIVSISWGGPEDTYTAQDLTSFNKAFQAAAAMGVSVFVAAGDQGSTDGEPPVAHVDFPASSPFVTACGGTRLLTGAGGAVTSETVWNDGAAGGATGGGISAVFPVPDYQQNLYMPQSPNPGAGPGRGVPDVSGNADPVTGYKIIVDGASIVVGGTSAVAPLWAGLAALINESLGQSLGFANPLLYSTTVAAAPGALYDVTQGNNDTTNLGAYYAGPGWDACSGMGTPRGTALLNALQST